MKRVDFVSPGARLEEAFRKLEAAWVDVQPHWNDAVSQKVEEDYLLPLRAQIRSLTDAISKTSQTMRRAEWECQHERERGGSL